MESNLNGSKKEQVVTMLKDGKSVSEIARLVSVSRPYVYTLKNAKRTAAKKAAPTAKGTKPTMDFRLDIRSLLATSFSDSRKVELIRELVK
jgi:transposase